MASYNYHVTCFHSASRLVPLICFSALFLSWLAHSSEQITSAATAADNSTTIIIDITNPHFFDDGEERVTSPTVKLTGVTHQEDTTDEQQSSFDNRKARNEQTSNSGGNPESFRETDGGNLSSENSSSKISCQCEYGVVADCNSSTRCESENRYCRATFWYHASNNFYEIRHRSCSKTDEKMSHTHGGEVGDVIIVLVCYNEQYCNKFTQPESVLPVVCNYSMHVRRDPHYDDLKSLRAFCKSLDPVHLGPFNLSELMVLLSIPVGLALCLVGCVVLYTRRVDRCSLSAWKMFLATFVSPRCRCFRERRSQSRNSDMSHHQPLFEVTTLLSHVSTSEPTASKASVTDSGFSTTAAMLNAHRKTQGSSPNSADGAQRFTSTSSSGNTTAVTSGGGGGGYQLTMPAMRKQAHSPELTHFPPTIGEATNSGSGKGNPSLGRRTMAGQILLGDVIGRGRYGVVHRGEMFCDPVAVKIFQSRDERAWLRERQIYTTHGMQHDYILAFRGADSRDTGLTTELWLVTEYHPHGSLFDYLLQRTLTLPAALKLIYSIVAGLSHLHLEISGTPGKPAIAHRDLKSRNILVKSNHSCCLADFGFAVTYMSASNQLEQSPAATQLYGVGTRRYMANELLDRTFDSAQFISFASADLYAIALVFWEILRRTELDPSSAPADQPELPYLEFGAGVDPSYSDMLRIVCQEKHRPTIPTRFVSPETYIKVPAEKVEDKTALEETSRVCYAASSLGKMVEELWQESPTARPTALQVKKMLLRIRYN